MYGQTRPVSEKCLKIQLLHFPKMDFSRSLKMTYIIHFSFHFRKTPLNISYHQLHFSNKVTPTYFTNHQSYSQHMPTKLHMRPNKQCFSKISKNITFLVFKTYFWEKSSKQKISHVFCRKLISIGSSIDLVLKSVVSNLWKGLSNVSIA